MIIGWLLEAIEKVHFDKTATAYNDIKSVVGFATLSERSEFRKRTSFRNGFYECISSPFLKPAPSDASIRQTISKQ